MSDPLSDTARAQEVSERLARLSITETVGPVSVTVGANGIPTGIAMSDGVRELGPADIAASVMEATRKAQSRCSAHVAKILAETSMHTAGS
ncbi:YbaB/EbfC family nucleoid-associated protein [Actinophytocola sp.]|uniref:YbaB/EbfC family nucleoid-associated protein n=1 Tax=Actinophytocola sp. TaxID=1872138 RepID=UPI00389A29B1